jgi:integrase
MDSIPEAGVAMRGTVQKVGPSKWEARWRENGTQRKRRFRTKGMAEDAIRTASDREERRKSGIREPIEGITVGELADRYLASLHVVRQDWAEDMVAHSKRAFGAMRVDEISQEAVGRWLTGLPLGVSARRQALTKLRAILDDAVDLGYIARNPARGRVVRVPKVPQSAVCPFESWEEVEKVAAQAGSYASVVIWACATGMRPEEWAALRWIDVDIRAKTCRVSQVIVEGVIKRTGKTEGALRTIALPAVALGILVAMPRPLDGSELVFTAPKGGPISLRNFRRRVWYKALAGAGVERRPPYQCRHTFATLALAAGADIYWVSSQLGHADIGTTLKYYARFVPDVQERNLGLLNAYLGVGCLVDEGSSS